MGDVWTLVGFQVTQRHIEAFQIELGDLVGSFYLVSQVVELEPQLVQRLHHPEFQIILEGTRFLRHLFFGSLDLGVSFDPNHLPDLIPAQPLLFEGFTSDGRHRKTNMAGTITGIRRLRSFNITFPSHHLNSRHANFIAHSAGVSPMK